MNCCDANGKCNGGKGCPVGEPLPIDMLDDPANEGVPIWLDLITVDRAGRHADRALEGDGMSKLRDAAQRALEALEDHAKQYPHMQKGYTVDAITALRAALAEQPGYKLVPDQRRLDIIFPPKEHT